MKFTSLIVSAALASAAAEHRSLLGHRALAECDSQDLAFGTCLVNPSEDHPCIQCLTTDIELMGAFGGGCAELEQAVCAELDMCEEECGMCQDEAIEWYECYANEGLDDNTNGFSDCEIDCSEEPPETTETTKSEESVDTEMEETISDEESADTETVETTEDEQSSDTEGCEEEDVAFISCISDDPSESSECIQCLTGLEFMGPLDTCDDVEQGVCDELDRCDFECGMCHDEAIEWYQCHFNDALEDEMDGCAIDCGEDDGPELTPPEAGATTSQDGPDDGEAATEQPSTDEAEEPTDSGDEEDCASEDVAFFTCLDNPSESHPCIQCLSGKQLGDAFEGCSDLERMVCSELDKCERECGMCHDEAVKWFQCYANDVLDEESSDMGDCDIDCNGIGFDGSSA